MLKWQEADFEKKKFFWNFYKNTSNKARKLK